MILYFIGEKGAIKIDIPPDQAFAVHVMLTDNGYETCSVTQYARKRREQDRLERKEVQP